MISTKPNPAIEPNLSQHNGGDLGGSLPGRGSESSSNNLRDQEEAGPPVPNFHGDSGGMVIDSIELHRLGVMTSGMNSSMGTITTKLDLTGGDTTTFITDSQTNPSVPEPSSLLLRQLASLEKPSVREPINLALTAMCRDSERTELLAGLRKLELLETSFGYSAFPSSLIPRVCETGTYRFRRNGDPRPDVFCCLLGENLCGEECLIQCVDGRRFGGNDIHDYIADHFDYDAGTVGLAVFDLNKLTSLVEDDDANQFACADPREALVAVIKITLPVKY